MGRASTGTTEEDKSTASSVGEGTLACCALLLFAVNQTPCSTSRLSHTRIATSSNTSRGSAANKLSRRHLAWGEGGTLKSLRDIRQMDRWADKSKDR
jgi:hypothetical protein